MTIKKLVDLDFTLLAASVALTVIGILFIYSSGVTSEGLVVSNEYAKQIAWAGISVLAALTIALIDYRRLYDLAPYFYAAVCALLVYTRLFGRVVNGARSWIGFGGVGIQPSEFAKVATILLLAKYLDSSRRDEGSVRRFLVAAGIVLFPVMLIMLQPDLGTSLVFMPILIVMTFVAGVPLRYIVYTLLIVGTTSILMVLPIWEQFFLRGKAPYLQLFADPKLVGLFVLLGVIILCVSLFGFYRYRKRYFYWISYVASFASLSMALAFAARKVLKEYQIMRLIVFLNPEVDPRGSGWNIIQSVTAIGSGGLLGKGFLQGTQSHYRFLPQQSTDFIFSIFAEEWGFIGGIIVFGLYLALILRLVRIMNTTSDPFGAYICAGAFGMFIFHFIVNVGMVMGVMPITGIPLPFMSYGGSSLLVAMISVGLSLSIHLRRYDH